MEGFFDGREVDRVVPILNGGEDIIEADGQEGDDIFKIFFDEFFLDKNLHLWGHRFVWSASACGW